MHLRTDITAIGELLIDFTSLKIEKDRAVYEQNPGGAPANVLVAAQKLGKRTALIGKVGNDCFGRFLKSTVESENICTVGLVVSDEYPTTLAFVTLDEAGDRSFEFLRRKSADVMLTESDLDGALLDSCSVLHFGSVSLTDEPSRGATFKAIARAKEAGACISYDPNYRPLLWRDEAEAVELMRKGMRYANVIKVADNELTLLAGETDCLKGARKLVENGAKFSFVTLGERGCCYASASGECGYVPGFAVDVVDTTGAGDTFTGAVLSRLIDCKFSPAEGELEEIVRFANAAGALNTTKRGAIPAMPSLEEICALCRRQANGTSA